MGFLRKLLLSFSSFFLLLFLNGTGAVFAQSQAFDVQFTLTEPICAGERGSVLIDTAFGGTPPYRFFLGSELNPGVGTNPLFPSILPGEYNLFVIDSLDRRWDSLITINAPAPLEAFLVADNNPIEKGDAVTLQVFLSPENAKLDNILWFFDSQIIHDSSLVKTFFFEETTTVDVHIRDAEGCKTKQQIRVLVDDHSVYTPNVFMPESDQNAYFTLYSGGGVTKVLTLKIYDRWGRPVFQKENFPPNDPIQGWDGKLMGKTVQAGTYVYVALLEYFDGEKEQVKGELVVVRN